MPDRWRQEIASELAGKFGQDVLLSVPGFFVNKHGCFSIACMTGLLIPVRDARDEQAWSQFVDLYAPVVYRYARRQGLQDADAADLTQEVLRGVARSVERQGYDPGRGSFRNWLFTLARNRVRNFLTRRKPYHHGSGDSDAQRLLEAQPAPGRD